MKVEETAEEKLAAAEAELVTAQTIFQGANHALKRFDGDFPLPDAEQERERAFLKQAQSEALANLKEKEQIAKWIRDELYAANRHWGRSEPWRK